MISLKSFCLRKYTLPLVVFIVLASFFLVKLVIAPFVIKHLIVSAVRESCETCELSIGQLHFSLFPQPEISLNKISFQWGTRENTHVSFEIDLLRVPFSVVSLLSKDWLFGQFEIQNLRFIVTEGDGEDAPSKKKSNLPPRLNFELKGVKVQNASFRYIREHLGRQGIIDVSQIEAKIGPVGTSSRLIETSALGWAKGVLQDSGRFQLWATATAFSAPPDIDVKLEISGQDLSDLNQFFVPNDGIHLAGTLIQGRSTVAVRGKKLTSSVYALYKDFEVRLTKNEDRSALSAFLQTLLAAAKTGKQNTRGTFDRRGHADIERKKKQSIVSFILEGMKEAAFEVSSKAKK